MLEVEGSIVLELRGCDIKLGKGCFFILFVNRVWYCRIKGVGI